MWMALIFNHRRKKWMTGSSQLANSTCEKTYCFSSFGKKILLRVKLGDFPPGFYFLTDVAISNFRTNHCSCCFSHKFDSPLHSLTVVRTDGRTNGRNLPPFYSTSSPTGAAAQKWRRQPLRAKKQPWLLGSEKNDKDYHWWHGNSHDFLDLDEKKMTKTTIDVKERAMTWIWESSYLQYQNSPEMQWFTACP